jgi:actin-related protein 10
LLEFLPSQPLSLIPLNKKSGIIVDVGYSETTVLPVVSNSPLTHAMISNPIGAKTVHSRISQLLKSYPCSLPEGYILEDGIDSDPDAKALTHPLDAVILEDLCLQLCYVQTLGSGNDNASQYVPYIDRFGRLYRISKHVRAEASNILFRDEDKETPTVVNSILSSLLALSVDLRAKTAHKILLVGGTSLMRGFSTRLMQELELQVVSNPKFESLKALSGHFEFLESAKFYHPHLQWIGASVDATIEGTHTANQIQSSEFLQNKKPLPDWSSLTSHK